MKGQPSSTNVITLDTAVNEIKQASDATAGPRSPFFFLVGGGISSPAVPLSSAIQRQCQEIAREHGRSDAPSSTDPAEIYSHWFRAAFPHRILRQQFLRRLIENAPITHPNLRLADLLIQRRVSNMVVTPNFDDLLSRSLALFGGQHIICDDPRTVERIDPERQDIQLVHVHGSYWFYDCRNTTAEIEDRATPLPDTTLTMAALLDKILAYRAPLVIGYSGWESDVFMKALKRRLLTPLPFNLYWFCFRRAAIDSLPDFLNHPDVYFVVPPEVKTESVAPETDSPLTQNGARSTSSRDAPSEPELSATTVFDALIRELGSETPHLTKDPLSFFAEQLRRALPKEDIEGGRDIYSFDTVIQRVIRAQHREVEEARTIQRNDAQLEQLRELARRAAYDDALSIARSFDIRDLTETQLRELITVMDSVIRAIPDGAATKPLACDIIVDSYDALGKKTAPESLPWQQLVNASNHKGNSFYAAKSYVEAISAYNIALSRFGNSSERLVQQELAIVRNNNGLALRNLGRNEEASGLHSAVIDWFRDSSGDGILNTVAVACLFRGASQVNLQRYEDAVESFRLAREVTARIGDVHAYTKTNIKSTEGAELQAIAAVAAAGKPITNDPPLESA